MTPRAAWGVQGNPRNIAPAVPLSGQLRGLLGGEGIQESVGSIRGAVLQDLHWFPVGWNGQLLGHGPLYILQSHLLLPEPRSSSRRKEKVPLDPGENRLDDDPPSHIYLCPKVYLVEKPWQHRLETGLEL